LCRRFDVGVVVVWVERSNSHPNFACHTRKWAPTSNLEVLRGYGITNSVLSALSWLILLLKEKWIMKYIITIVTPFMVLGKTTRTIFPCGPCKAKAHDGIVQLAYPYGSFALPSDKFNERLKDGSISMEHGLI
jgi:hypothetical protein